jgi:deazaflavin-dependent oxidoreductase (nitroreductase family)
MESDISTRLKRVATRQTLILTHYGRKSGKPYDVTIWFVVDGDMIYIGTANVNRQWVRNVQKTPQVRLSIGGETFDGTARFLAGHAEHDHVNGSRSTEVLDVSAVHCAGADSHRHRRDALQDGVVRGDFGWIDLLVVRKRAWCSRLLQGCSTFLIPVRPVFHVRRSSGHSHRLKARV